MAPEIAAAIIASAITLVGVAVGVVASWNNSSRIAKTETQKLRIEIQQTYAGKLLEKRLETYPSLYRYLSDFVKLIEFQTVSKVSLQELRTNLETWDSQYSLFFSGYTTDRFHEFRVFVAEISQMPDEDVRKIFSETDGKTALKRRIAEVELALKADLGIYIVEFPEASKKSFRFYEEIEGLVK
jgi:hypothetical protein